MTNSMFANSAYMRELGENIFHWLQKNPTSTDIASTHLGLIQLTKEFKASNVKDFKPTLGNIVTEKLQRGLRYFKTPSRAGYVPAQFFEGVCLSELASDIESQRLGFSLIMAAAHSNFVPALNYLGGVYARGHAALSIPPNHKQAFKMFSRAAELNVDPAGQKRGQRNVGMCLLHGFGVQKNMRAGIRYLAVAASSTANVAGDTIANSMLHKLWTNIRLAKQRHEAAQARAETFTNQQQQVRPMRTGISMTDARAVTPQFAATADSQGVMLAVGGDSRPAEERNVVSMVPKLQGWR